MPSYSRSLRKARRSLCRATSVGTLLSFLVPAVGYARVQEESATEAEAGGEEAATEEQAPSDAELDAELKAEQAAQEAALRKPPAKGKGAIVGTITDTKFDEPIIEGRVQVVGSKREVFTDTEGRFRLELPPGKYSLRISYEMHQPTRVDEVEVLAGAFVEMDAKLTPDENAVETVTIEDEADRTSLEGQTLQRQRSAAVGDGVGRAEIARTPDRNAAEAAQRVVGASIVSGRFVYVRGLGERYTNSLLNGTPLPSPEPDRQSVPLDLFPSLVLDSLTINKQFTPDMPGDFAGGSVRINTREFPRQTLFQISLSGGFNTETTFRQRLGSHGSSTDYLGYDDGVRQLPSTIPQKRLDDNVSPEERRYWGRWLNSYMSTKPKFMPPNHSISIVAGDSWKLSDSRKLGAVAALTYSHSYQTRMVSARRYRLVTNSADKEVPAVSDTADGEQTVDGVRIGAFATVALDVTKTDRLVLTGLRSQSADDSASEFEGFDENAGATFRNIHVEYVSRSLNVLQLRGQHDLKKLNDADLQWNVSLSEAQRAEPDTRDTEYRRSPNGQPLRYSWIPGSNSGSHFYSDQSETSLGAGLDYTQPFLSKSTKVKVGGLVNSREREFSARRFVLEPDNNLNQPPPNGFRDTQVCDGGWRSDCPDRFFRLPNIVPGGLNLRETTQQYDGYNASLGVLAGYGMLDFEATKKLRLIGGVRAEHTRQQFSAFSPNDPGLRVVGSNIKHTDLLPAFSAVYAMSAKTNVRFGVSKTLARPQLREISPFYSQGYTLDLPVQGNPDLKLTGITNVDVRFEQFPTLREVVAFSVFYKHFRDPIEEVVRNSSAGSLITYANAPSADLVGAELEARKSLEFLTSALQNFSILGNLTLTYSRVSFGNNRGAATNPTRPLSRQSPYIVNLSFDYSNPNTNTDIRILYNVFGARITAVGADNLPDTYELPRHIVDLTLAQKLNKRFELKAAATNLLHTAVRFVYKDAQAYRQDANGTVPTEKDPLIQRYNPGSTFTLTASYTY
jgi:TonB-dependent receptor